jgi:hypothetical protein
MLGDISVSLDLLAAVITVCYLAKLMFVDNSHSFGKFPAEKRSLLHQHVSSRQERMLATN